MILSPRMRSLPKSASAIASRLTTARAVCWHDIESSKNTSTTKNSKSPTSTKPSDDAHPGVKIVRGQGNWNLAGAIDVITPTHEPEFSDYRLPPAKTREEFAANAAGTRSLRFKRAIRFIAVTNI